MMERADIYENDDTTLDLLLWTTQLGMSMLMD